MINLNYTILIEMVIFVTLVVVMNKLFYKPIFDILDRRRELIDGNKRQAEELSKKAEALLSEYEKKLLEARQKAVALVNEARQAAQEEQKEAIAKARAEMEKALAELKKQLEKEKEEARKVLRQTANLLAVLIAEKLVGRKFEEERV